MAAFALSRLMSHLLFEVSPEDPLSYASVVVVFAVIAFLACFVPARRAAKVDPMVALRYE
jgi:putative ABC transport system permease protein